ncbi:GNAT family N-acetyltransferase [Peptostreptococcus faecalis]|uniref:GNAT family N-acetyltransferase n=1 Tax=Peptostreptococcus faecalis TaxID=2045015 RepID=UPI000C7A4165|nr:GNAT family N-acetyltransferase [Peptostreptococcus faecalis]
MDFIYEENRIYLNDENGDTIAEIDFPKVGENHVDLNHTYVSPVLRGQGVAEKLLLSAIDVIKSKNWKAYTSCSYVDGWAESHPEKTDIFIRD